MATNSSEKQKTLYDMFQRFPSDIWTLDNLQTYCNYNNISIMPLNYILDDYRDYFEVNGFLKKCMGTLETLKSWQSISKFD